MPFATVYEKKEETTTPTPPVIQGENVATTLVVKDEVPAVQVVEEKLPAECHYG